MGENKIGVKWVEKYFRSPIGVKIF